MRDRKVEHPERMSMVITLAALMVYMMFPIYMDELLNQLQASCICCHIGHEYYGSLGYEDDLKLLCADLRGL